MTANTTDGMLTELDMSRMFSMMLSSSNLGSVVCLCVVNFGMLVHVSRGFAFAKCYSLGKYVSRRRE